MRVSDARRIFEAGRGDLHDLLIDNFQRYLVMLSTPITDIIEADTTVVVLTAEHIQVVIVCFMSVGSVVQIQALSFIHQSHYPNLLEVTQNVFVI